MLMLQAILKTEMKRSFLNVIFFLFCLHQEKGSNSSESKSYRRSK